MKKKIDYGGVPDSVLDMVVGECYSFEEYTLRSELDKYGEDILAAQYNLKNDRDDNGPYIEWFRAWTKTYALILIETMFGDRSILGLNREIPEELNVEKKLTGADHSKLLRPLRDTTIDSAIGILNKQGYCFSIQRLPKDMILYGRTKEKKRRTSKTNRKNVKR
jgi:hypothetical protein